MKQQRNKPAARGKKKKTVSRKEKVTSPNSLGELLIAQERERARLAGIQEKAEGLGAFLTQSISCSLSLSEIQSLGPNVVNSALRLPVPHQTPKYPHETTEPHVRNYFRTGEVHMPTACSSAPQLPRDLNLILASKDGQGQDEKISCHRTLVGMFSLKILRMLTNSESSPMLLESTKQEKGKQKEKEGELMKGISEVKIELDTADRKIFKFMLYYMYTGRLAGLEQNEVFSLLRLAHEFEASHIKERCGEILGAGVDESNCTDLLNVAHMYECKQLDALCGQFLATHFNDILEEDRQKLFSLKPSTWQAMLQSDDLQILSDEQLFEEVVAYSKQFEAGPRRDEVLTSLLPLLSFPLMSARFLVERVEQEETIKHLPIVFPILNETYRYRMAPDLYRGPRLGSSIVRMKPRKGYFFKWNLGGNDAWKLSEDGYTLTKAAQNDIITTIKTSEGLTEGSYIWDIMIDKYVGGDYQVGVVDSSFTMMHGWMKGQPGAHQVDVASGDRWIRCELDMSERTVTFRDADGNLRGTGSGLSSPIYPAVSIRNIGSRCTILSRKIHKKSKKEK